MLLESALTNREWTEPPRLTNNITKHIEEKPPLGLAACIPMGNESTGASLFLGILFWKCSASKIWIVALTSYSWLNSSCDLLHTQKDSICVIYYEDQTALSCFYCQANFNNNIIVSLFQGEKKNLNDKEFWQGILVFVVKWCHHKNHELLSKDLNHSCRKCTLLSKLVRLKALKRSALSFFVAWINKVKD